MPGIVRLNDTCTGHGCFPSRPNSSASTNLFVDGKGVHRVGDSWQTHCCGSSCHSGTAASGSSNYFNENKAICRCGDAVDCGSTMATCSSTHFNG